MDTATLNTFIDAMWEDEIVPTLTDYIKIPNKSPSFDPDWEKHGYMRDAVNLLEGWARKKIAAMSGAKLDVVQLPGRTPVIFIEIPGEKPDTVLLYGHLDKQPEFTGWAEGLGPWIPVRRGDRLFGRGGADDGYAMFGSLAALLALRDQRISHARCVILIEACEESGSTDLPYYVDHLKGRIGEPSLVVCLDSGCANYDQLWVTTSLRGMMAGQLKVQVLEEGVHSGDASGIVPSSFRILENLMARIEDPKTGSILIKELYAEIPRERLEQAARSAQALGKDVYAKFPWSGGTQPVTDDLVELILNRTWRPQVTLTGMEGPPLPKDAGNVMLPQTTAKLSFRLPAGVDGERATAAIKRVLEADPPYNATVSFKPERGSTGWNAPAMAPWLEASLDKASRAAFGAPAAYMGEGGSIPFITMLGEKFPKTQFVVTGVLGPNSNAHGPNEFLHIPTGKHVTSVVAQVIADHFARREL